MPADKACALAAVVEIVAAIVETRISLVNLAISSINVRSQVRVPGLISEQMEQHQPAVRNSAVFENIDRLPGAQGRRSSPHRYR